MLHFGVIAIFHQHFCRTEESKSKRAFQTTFETFLSNSSALQDCILSLYAMKLKSTNLVSTILIFKYGNVAFYSNWNTFQCLFSGHKLTQKIFLSFAWGFVQFPEVEERYVSSIMHPTEEILF